MTPFCRALQPTRALSVVCHPLLPLGVLVNLAKPAGRLRSQGCEGVVRVAEGLSGWG